MYTHSDLSVPCMLTIGEAVVYDDEVDQALRF